MVESALIFEVEELGLLSHFFQNTRTLCQVLAGEMRDKQVTEYVVLLESLADSLSHAWPVVASLEKKGNADLRGVQECVQKVNIFLGVVRTHKSLTPMDRRELTEAVGDLHADLSEFVANEEKVHRMVGGIKEQLKKVVNLLSENLGGFTGKSLGALKDLVTTFERSFGKLLGKEGEAKERLVEELKGFLRDKEAEAVRLLGEGNVLPGDSFKI